MVPASKIKFVKSLQTEKFRKLHGLFPVEGPTMVKELLKSDFTVDELFAVRSWFEEAKDEINSFGGNVYEVTEKELNRLSGLKTPNKVLATAKIPENKISGKIFNHLLIALDEIADPGNLGTIIRIADWFGIQNIICSPHTAGLFNPKVVRATMGSLFRVRLFYVDLGDVFIKYGKNLPILGATLTGENIYKARLPEKAVVVIGNEARGISPGIRSHLTGEISIPLFGQATESLNAAVATGIICSEFLRRRSVHT